MDGTPQRPADVPEGAVWIGEAGEWRHGAADGRGEKQGVHRSWRSDGSLREEVRFVDGKGVGPYRRFHPNGALAGEGELVDGNMQGTLRTFACDAPTTEQLQPCCVPANAWELQTDYHRGEIMARRWYDRQGTQILDSGEPHPVRPPSVPAQARYDEASARWVIGSYAAEGGKAAHWRRWSRDGVLVEEEDFVDGVRHGVWRRFREGDGGLVFEAHYDRGLKHGPFRDRTAAGAGYRDARVADEQGQFQHGLIHGVWILRDADGATIEERDLGVAVADDALARSPAFAVADLREGRDVGEGEPRESAAIAARVGRGDEAAARWSACARALAAERRHGEAIVAMARGVALSGDPAPLRGFIDQLTCPRIAAAAHDIAATAIEADGDRLAALLDALVRGGDAASLLRAFASALRGGHRAALQIVDGALTLTPDAPGCLLTRALVNVHIGAPAAARADAGRLPDEWSEQRQNLLDYIRVTFPPFDFAPARTVVETVFEEYPEAPAQPLPAIRAAVQRYATRLSEIRAALARQIGVVVDRATDAPDWFPPAPPTLLPDGPVVLATWTFQERSEGSDPDQADAAQHGDGDGEGDADRDADADAPPGQGAFEEILVDERLVLDGMSIPTLLCLARREWAALSWLCWSCGLDGVALPDADAPPADFGRAAGMSIERAWRCRDKLASGGLVAMSKGVPGFEWEGIPIDAMPRAVAEIATDEHIEVRAMFLWLCDAAAQSPWQSDLRDD